MVDRKVQLDSVFAALADPTRRSMMSALKTGEKSVVELAAPFDMTLAGAAKHVKVLEQSKLINRRKQGRTSYCSINHEALLAAQKWLQEYAEFWSSKLDSLEVLLQQERESKNG